MVDHLFIGGTRISPRKAYIYLGFDGSLIRSHTGKTPGDYFGKAVDGVSDMNADGCDDYIIGAPSWEGPTTNVGRLNIFSEAIGSLLFPEDEK